MDPVTPPFIKLLMGNLINTAGAEYIIRACKSHTHIFFNALTTDYRRLRVSKGSSNNVSSEHSTDPVNQLQPTGLIKPSRKRKCLFTRRRGDLKPFNWRGNETTALSKTGQ